MNREDVGAREELVPGDQDGAGRGGALGGEVLAPGDELHAEGLADGRHAQPEASEAEDRERPAVQGGADRALPAALAHALMLLREMAHAGEDQRPGELRGRVLRVPSPRVADDHAALLRSRNIERAVVRAG